MLFRAVPTRPDKELFDWDALGAACRRHLNGNDLNADERNRVSLVAKALGDLRARNGEDKAKT
jgi:hypothetical protein